MLCGMKRQRLTAARWRERIEQQRDGGEAVEAFCRGHGLAVSTFYAWRRRLETEDRPAFVELTGADQTPGDRVRQGIEVVLLSGVVLRVPESFDTATLRRVVEVFS